jgi:hypothetical protein
MNVKGYSNINQRKKSEDEKLIYEKNKLYNLLEENKDFVSDTSNLKEDPQVYLETNNNENQEDLINYKGQYYNDEKEEKYYEGGAHFQYHDLYYKLEKIAKKSKNRKIISNEESDIDKNNKKQENTCTTAKLEINNYQLISNSTISKEALLKINLQQNLHNIQQSTNSHNIKSNHIAIKSFREGNKNIYNNTSNNINQNQLSSGILITNLANSNNPIQITSGGLINSSVNNNQSNQHQNSKLTEVTQTTSPIFKKVNPNLTHKQNQSNNKSPLKEDNKKQYLFKNRNTHGDTLEKKINNTKIKNSNLTNRNNQSTNLIKSPSINLFTNKVLMKLNVTNISKAVNSKILHTQEKNNHNQNIRNNLLNPSLVVNKISDLNTGTQKLVSQGQKITSPVSKTTHIINELNKISNGTLNKSRNLNLSRPKVLTDNYTKNSKISNFTKINPGKNLHSNRVNNSNIGQALLNSFNLNFNTLDNKSRSRNTFRNRNVIEESNHTTTDNKTFYLKTNDSHQSLSGSHKFLSSTMRIEPNMTMMNNMGISSMPPSNVQVPVNVTNVTNLNMNVNVNNIILKDSRRDYDPKEIERDQDDKNSSNKKNNTHHGQKTLKHISSISILNNFNEKLTNAIKQHFSSTMKNNLSNNFVRSSSDLLPEDKKLRFNSKTDSSKGNTVLSHRENNHCTNSILNSPVQKFQVNLNLQNFSNLKNTSGNLNNFNSSSNTSNTYTNSNTNIIQNRSLSRRGDRRVLMSRNFFLILNIKFLEKDLNKLVQIKKEIPGSNSAKKDSRILKFLLLNQKERKEFSPGKDTIISNSLSNNTNSTQNINLNLTNHISNIISTSSQSLGNITGTRNMNFRSNK